MRRLLISLALVAGIGQPALAGTISGTIRNTAGAGLAGMEVRAWSQNSKGWAIAATTTSAEGGGYSLTVTDGTYKVDARMGPGVGGNYGDRWYDVAAPTSGGYVGDSADELAIAGAVAGIDLILEVLGGADGTVQNSSGAPLASMMVRAERAADPRVHHVDITKAAPHLGLQSFRGMPPATDYRYLAYDPNGNLEFRVYNGPYTVNANAVATAPTITLTAAPADPYEGNNSPSCAGGIDLGPTLRQNPPQPLVTSDARIGPRGSDPDWFCFAAVEGDRLLVSTSTAVNIGGSLRDHPWTDPIVAFWAGAGTSKLVEDDDSGSGYNAALDTGPLTAGCHCVSVSAFGDPDYNGSGQGSSGRYQLTVEMGNRPPVLWIRKGDSDVPVEPSALVIAEGETLALDLGYPDADGDAVTPTFTHLDNGDAPVTGGSLTLGASTGDYRWTVPPDGASGSPYRITLQGQESEFTVTRSVVVVVTSVNDPPSLPVPIAPIAGAVVATDAPALRWMNATDPDGDSISYDVELYYDDTDHLADQGGTIAEDASGQSGWQTAAIPENTRAYWRVRARDGSGGLSQWTGFEPFLVDSANDPPETPILTKPSNFETVFARRPGLSVINVADPEQDDVEFLFEVARDGDFTALVWASDGVAMNDLSGTTMTVVGDDLDWGASYYARAMARDARGAESDWSNVRQFSLKQNVAPDAPAFDGGCQILEYNKNAPDVIVVTNVDDLEGEQVTFELEIFFIDDDPASAAPVLVATAVQAANSSTTAIPFDVGMLENGHYRYRVRASDGTDASDWIECEMILAIEGNGGGGCCQSTTSPVELAFALALIWLLVVRRRRC